MEIRFALVIEGDEHSEDSDGTDVRNGKSSVLGVAITTYFSNYTGDGISFGTIISRVMAMGTLGIRDMAWKGR